MSCFLPLLKKKDNKKSKGAEEEAEGWWNSLSDSATKTKTKQKISGSVTSQKFFEKPVAGIANTSPKLLIFIIIKMEEKEKGGKLSSRFLGNLLCLGNHLLNTSDHVKWLFWKIIVLSIQHTLLIQTRLNQLDFQNQIISPKEDLLEFIVWFCLHLTQTCLDCKIVSLATYFSMISVSVWAISHTHLDPSHRTTTWPYPTFGCQGN